MNDRRALSLTVTPIEAGLLLFCTVIALQACSRPFHVWEAYTYATPIATFLECFHTCTGTSRGASSGDL